MGEDSVLARREARLEAVRRVMGTVDGELMLELLEDVFEVDLPCFQDRRADGGGVVRRRGYVGEYDALDAMRRDGNREVCLFLRSFNDGFSMKSKMNDDGKLAVARSAAGKDEQEEKAKGVVEAVAAFLAAMGVPARWVTVIAGVLGLAVLVYFTLFASGCAAVADVRLWGEDGSSLVIQRDPVTGVVLVQGSRAPVVVQKGK